MRRSHAFVLLFTLASSGNAWADSYCPQPGDAFIAITPDGSRAIHEPKPAGIVVYTDHRAGASGPAPMRSFQNGLLGIDGVRRDGTRFEVRIEGDVNLTPPQTGSRTVSYRWWNSSSSQDGEAWQLGGKQTLTISALDDHVFGECTYEAAEYMKISYFETGPLFIGTETGWYVPSLGTRLSYIFQGRSHSGRTGRILRLFERFEPYDP